MTEVDWLAGDNPDAMLVYLWEGGLLSRRKACLFAVACWRRVEALLGTDEIRSLMDDVEMLADRLPTDEAAAVSALPNGFRASPVDVATSAVAWCSGLVADASLGSNHPKGMGDAVAAERGERQAQCRLVREVFGNPFRPAVVRPEWLTPAVVALAEAAYQERQLPGGELEPERLGVLSDALEEAGCADAEVLGHLRRGGHVRGCHLLDLLLGRD